MKFLIDIEQIIIHCSASDNPKDDSIIAIENLHTLTSEVTWNGKLIKGRGFEDIGYHWVITKDGELHKGRSEKYQGAHCYGQNSDSIGICLTGDKDITLGQYRTLFVLLDFLKLRYDIKDDKVKGHYEYSNKTCPNFQVF